MVDNHTDSAMLEGRGEDGGTEGWALRCQFSKGGGGFVTFFFYFYFFIIIFYYVAYDPRIQFAKATH